MGCQTTSDEKTITDAKVVNRRRVLYLLGWGFIGVFLTSVVGSAIRFFFPRIIYEPPTKYKVGYPLEYTLGVSERFKKKFRVWIVRETDRIYVVQANVPIWVVHLTGWHPKENSSVRATEVDLLLTGSILRGLLQDHWKDLKLRCLKMGRLWLMRV